MCQVLRVARSGWYVWRNRRNVIGIFHRFRLGCDSAVRDAFDAAKQRYGASHLADELREQGLNFNIKTVAASLSRQGLRAKAARRFSPVSYCEHGLPVSENLLKQDFSARSPNQRSGRATSLTYGQMKAGYTLPWS
jgi:putative transposase